MISTPQAAALLNLSERRIRQFLEQGRIAGAVQVGGVWVLPDNPVIGPAPKYPSKYSTSPR